MAEEKPGMILYELCLSKFIKKATKGWDSIHTILSQETSDLDDVLKELKLNPSKVKTIMQETEKEYLEKKNRRAKTNGDPIEMLEKEMR